MSTRQVKAITEEPCGHQFSSATISRAIQKWEEELARLAQRESATSGKELLQRLVACGLRGVEDVVSDDHSGLRWLRSDRTGGGTQRGDAVCSTGCRARTTST